MRIMQQATSNGNRLRELMKAADLKRHHRADEWGVDPSTIFRWEQNGPPRDQLPRLAERFGVSIEHLMGWDEAAA
jgi:transcriptional regulator with XRE-family HTH domain